MSDLSADAKPAIAQGLRMQWEPAQNAHVLLYPEGMVKLNASAAAIMNLCDGARSIREIVTGLEQMYGATGLTGEVTAFVTLAAQKNWLEIRG
jgi:pyrroloquinoline quinone biosynthesis protein D